jgi:hypothetical protein
MFERILSLLESIVGIFRDRNKVKVAFMWMENEEAIRQEKAKWPNEDDAILDDLYIRRANIKTLMEGIESK